VQTRSRGAIRQVEQRFHRRSAQAVSAQDRLLNGLYRMVEMMQLFVALSDQELPRSGAADSGEVSRRRIAHGIRCSRWRNGFCRLFELGHLVTTHLDEIL